MFGLCAAANGLRRSRFGVAEQRFGDGAVANMARKLIGFERLTKRATWCGQAATKFRERAVGSFALRLSCQQMFPFVRVTTCNRWPRQRWREVRFQVLRDETRETGCALSSSTKKAKR